MSWTGATELRLQLRKLWDSGRILSGETVFPLRLRLKAPTSEEWSSRFEDARSWARDLAALPWLRLVERMIRHPVLGTNAFPAEAWIDSPENAAACLGASRDLDRFRQILDLTQARLPSCLPWLRTHPLKALEVGDAWARILSVVVWVQEHPRPGIFLRELNLQDVDTKFVEAHRGVLSGLLDLALPPEAVDKSCPVSDIEGRYGFRRKPLRVRVRILDPLAAQGMPGGARDLEIEAEAFARWDPTGIETIFVVENEVTFLAFPEQPGSLVLFGSGYGFESLAEVRWFISRHIFYWGDLDTHGFSILDGFRKLFPDTRSLLMDRETFLAHRLHWSTEPRPAVRNLERLTREESSLYQELAESRHGQCLRLEQERIGFHHLRDELDRI